MVTRADLEEWQNDPTANAPEVAYDAPEVSRVSPRILVLILATDLL